MARLKPSCYGHVESTSPFIHNDPSVDQVSHPCEKKSPFRERHCDAGGEAARRDPAPWTATGGDQRLCVVNNNRELGKHKAARREDENAHDRTQTSPGSSLQVREEDYLELFMLADQELGSEKSADYGFIVGVVCLVTGISLVAISYAVPRDVRVDPDGVSAREMERLERENARVGAHLDRCVIAGLCLLTLGGVVLAMLLMVSMWKWESMRRKAFAYSKHAAKLYGSVSLRAGPTPLRESPSRSAADLEALR